MMQATPHILITNDDGITSPGLLALKDALTEVGCVTVLAPSHWIGGPAPTGVEEEGTDIWAIAHGYISVTPIQLDLTAHGVLEMVQGWGLMLQ